jgi:hypothetical protein
MILAFSENTVLELLQNKVQICFAFFIYHKCDDVIELKEAYDRVLADKDKYFEFLINNPYSELTVKEFDSVNQKFIDVDLEKLWEYADKLNHN